MNPVNARHLFYTLTPRHACLSLCNGHGFDAFSLNLLRANVGPHQDICHCADLGSSVPSLHRNHSANQNDQQNQMQSKRGLGNTPPSPYPGRPQQHLRTHAKQACSCV